ncbi:MAG: TRAP transporter small permease subunit [Alphaproteobacteria bacterium]|nr:TRAP transporter small permease subunit [Alphaproteobacteria bacterium]
MERLRRLAEDVAAASIAAVFVLFVIGVGARYLFNNPISWIDEVVTILSVWSTFWTAALVLKWREFIAFDVVFEMLGRGGRRAVLVAGIVLFVAITGAAMPGMVDYTLFLWRETTDTLRWRLDWVYSVFPAFFAVVAIRLLLALRRLTIGAWQAELAEWSAGEGEAER